MSSWGPLAAIASVVGLGALAIGTGGFGLLAAPAIAGATGAAAGGGLAAGLGYAGLAAGAAGGLMQTKAAGEKKQSLDLQFQQQRLQQQQRSIQSWDMTQKIMDTQLGQASAAGVSLSSPSFLALQGATIDVGQKEQKNLDMQMDVLRKNLKIEKSSVSSELWSSLFGTSTTLAFGASNLFSKEPKKQPNIFMKG